MSINNNGESKSEVTEGKRVKNTPKRRKFRSFSLGKYYMLEIDIILIEIDNPSNIEISNLR